MELLIPIAAFITILLLGVALYLGFFKTREAAESAVKKRLQRFTPEEGADLLRRVELSTVPWLNSLLLRMRISQQLSMLLQQSGVEHPVGFFMLLALLIGSVGFWLGWLISSSFATAGLIAVGFSMLPIMYIKRQKKKRMEKFQVQLPDALDMMARAMKAGHAFGGALKMVADDFDDPIGPEIGKVVHEVNYGIPLNESLVSLTERIDCADLKYFVTSVLIQRETGGNLTEILEKIAHLIRERFRLMGKIQVLAAEGKFSAYIMIALPFAIGGVVSLMSPEYMKPLLTQPAGHKLILGSVGFMGLGVLIIRSMIRIEV